MSDNFREAYLRARAKIGEAAWALLSDDEQTEAVAAEMRALRGERDDPPGDEDGEKPEQ